MGVAGQIGRAVAPVAPMNNDLISFAPRAQDGAALRAAFGRFGTGVTVITTQTETGPLGMTANSFSSVSLDPPMILWSAALRSKRHDIFAKAPHFCIHILAEDQGPLARHFAGQGHDFSGFDWQEGPHGTPTLAGVLATFHCETHAVHPAGDHSIILGLITHAAQRRGHGAGLLFDQGRFGTFVPQDPQ